MALAWHVDLALTEGQRAIEEQKDALVGLRLRAISLFGALSVAVGFLAGRSLNQAVISIVAAIAYSVSVLALIAVNWGVKFQGPVDPHTILQGWADQTPESGPRFRAEYLAGAVRANRSVLAKLRWCFLAEAFSGGAAVLLWSVALIGR